MKKSLLAILVSVLMYSFSASLSSSMAFAVSPSLTLIPSNSTIFVGQSLSVDVKLASEGNQHSGTFFEVTYDPSLLKLNAVQQSGVYFNFLDNSINNTTGLATLRGNFFGGNQSTSGTMAMLSFTALSSGSASIDFTGNTKIFDQSAQPFVGSVLSPTSITINPAESGARLTLSSAYADWALNDQQTIVVSLDTRGNSIAGVDMLLKYNPALFQYVSNQWMSLLPNQQGFSVDSTNGLITVSGVTNQNNPYNGVGELIKITFRSLAFGSDTFSFNWSLGTTTDTNIVSSLNPNVDLLAVAPTALPINIIDSATLSFKFGLLDFLGDITTKRGSITVISPGVTSSFTNPSSLGEVLNLALGTFSYGISHDLVLRVPGYLAKKQAQVITSGVNPSTGFTNFGNLTPGDVNQDDVVNTFDLFGVFNSWNTIGANTADLNGDSKVNTFDVGILYAYYNQTAAL